MNRPRTLSPESAQDIAVRALMFVADDPAILSRFLKMTGWTPESLSAAETRNSAPQSALDFLMGAEDLLLIFAANTGLDPADIASAHNTLQHPGTSRGGKG